MARREVFPCRGCRERFVGCHGGCEAYRAARAAMDARYLADKPRRAAVGEIIEMRRDAVERAKKRRRGGE